MSDCFRASDRQGAGSLNPKMRLRHHSSPSIQLLQKDLLAGKTKRINLGERALASQFDPLATKAYVPSPAAFSKEFQFRSRRDRYHEWSSQAEESSRPGKVKRVGLTAVESVLANFFHTGAAVGSTEGLKNCVNT